MMADRKAYAVLENFENTGAVVFAKHAVTARRVGADQYADGDFSGVSCRRAPWADEFADSGIVPVSEAIYAGWNFECSGCGMYMDEDSILEAGLSIDGIIGHQHSRAFCHAECEQEYDKREQIKASFAARWIARFERIISAKYPAAEIVGRHYSYVTYKDGKRRIMGLSVGFSLPGMRHGKAQLQFRRDYPRFGETQKIRFSCPIGDKAVFDTLSPPHNMEGIL